MYTFCELFICFIIFSFLGWCLEVIYGIFETKKFVNRGFLIGPLCPIYGTGCILIYLLLNTYKKDFLILFVMSMVVCSVLEYLASYVMEKLFKVRWWDYSNMKYNINGRICLETMLPFGLLGLLVIYVLFPYALKIIHLLPAMGVYSLAVALLILFIIDLVLSLNIALKFKTTALIGAAKDSTEDIKKFVKDALYKQSKRARRLIDSFPNYKFTIDFKKIRERLNIKNRKKD